MESKPIIEFKGTNGKIQLYEDFVRLDRGTLGGLLTHGCQGKKDIYFENITSIQIKKPGLMGGHLRFSVPGTIDGRHPLLKGIGSSRTEENTISFNWPSDYKKALNIKEYIEKRMSKCSASQTNSISDELLKLNELQKSGAISAREFKELKEKLMKKE